MARKSSKIKVGVIGLGIGFGHVDSFSKLPDVEVAAIADLNESRLKGTGDRYKIKKRYKDYKELLKDTEIDAVSICLPNYLHAPATIEALNSGKHVIVEKPMAMNADEAQQMVETAEKNKKKLMIAVNNRYRTDSQFLKDLVEQGEIGEVYYGEAGWIRRMNYAGGWFREKAKSGGGPLIDLGVHMLDLILYLIGDFDAESVYGVTYTKVANTDVEDIATAIIRLKSGTSVHLMATWECFAPNLYEHNEIQYLRLYGTEGGAVLHPLRIHKRIKGRLADMVINIRPEEGGKNSRDREIEHFIDCIKNDKTPISSGEQGVKVMKILDAIYKSAETGRDVLIK